MKPINFKGVNLTLAKDQPQYTPLPVCYTGGQTGGPEHEMTCCFKLSWRERLKMLFNGKFFISQLTFAQSYHPIRIALEFKPEPCVHCGRPPEEHEAENLFRCPSTFSKN